MLRPIQSRASDILWNIHRKKLKYLICNTSDIVLDTWLGQGTVDRIQASRFHCCQCNPAQLNYPTFQKDLRALMDSLKFFQAQLRAINLLCGLIRSPCRDPQTTHRRHRNCVNGNSVLVVQIAVQSIPQVSRIMSQVHCPETIRDPVLLQRKKSRYFKASTTRHYNGHQHYHRCLTLPLTITSVFLR